MSKTTYQYVIQIDVDDDSGAATAFAFAQDAGEVGKPYTGTIEQAVAAAAAGIAADARREQYGEAK
jgi:hypothetical protein